MTGKIFGIGLSKTGTHSLTKALRILGYRTRHYFFDLDEIEELDAATDTPIARAYKELDRKYPGSRFVLTQRDLASWLDACRVHFASDADRAEKIALRLDVYGTRAFDERRFRSARRRHLRDVQRHFRDRPGDLLVLDICGGEGWEPLCRFLGRPVPDLPFPHVYSRTRG